MVDVNPRDTQDRYSPRSTDLVDAVAEAKRIADQTMRANPLEDAVVTQGLTRFVGNYGGDFAWFGEFLPYDQNLEDDFGNLMPQRGISFVRDDPQGNSAFAMYDWNPQPGVPLRQKVSMHDADGVVVYQEGIAGGRAFPDKAIPMYQRVAIDNGGRADAAPTLIWGGEGNLTGRRVNFAGVWSTGGTITVSNFLRFSGGGVSFDTPTTTNPPQVTQDVSSIFDVSDYINVDWYVWRSAGTGTVFPYPLVCRTYSQ